MEVNDLNNFIAITYYCHIFSMQSLVFQELCLRSGCNRASIGFRDSFSRKLFKPPNDCKLRIKSGNVQKFEQILQFLERETKRSLNETIKKRLIGICTNPVEFGSCACWYDKRYSLQRFLKFKQKCCASNKPLNYSIQWMKAVSNTEIRCGFICFINDSIRPQSQLSIGKKSELWGEPR